MPTLADLMSGYHPRQENLSLADLARWSRLPQSPNVEDRRDQWARGLLGRMAPATLYSMEDWKQMLLHPLTPFNPPYEGAVVPPTQLGTAAGIGDIKSDLQKQYDKLRDTLWNSGVGGSSGASP
jgi:hypothetical protein